MCVRARVCVCVCACVCVALAPQALQARAGVWDFPGWKKIAIKFSTGFLGASLANSLVTYLLTAVAFMLIALLLGWNLCHDTFVGVVEYMGVGKIIIIVSSPLINMIINKIFFTWMGPKQVIKKRYASAQAHAGGADRRDAGQGVGGGTQGKGGGGRSCGFGGTSPRGI